MANQILEGYSSTDILEYGVKTWEVHIVTVRNYLTAARKAILLDYSEDRKRRVTFAVKQRNRLYNRAMAMGDLGNALAALKDISKLRGDYPVEGQPPPLDHDTTDPADAISGLDVADKRRVLAKLKEELGE